LFLLFLVIGVLALSAHAKLGQYGKASSRQSIYAKNIKISVERHKSVSAEITVPPASAALAVEATPPTPPVSKAAPEEAELSSPASDPAASNLWRRPPPLL